MAQAGFHDSCEQECNISRKFVNMLSLCEYYDLYDANRLSRRGQIFLA